ncbi:MAG: hypothetical protein AAFP02_15585, partial [Bacteroidota bacterium]
DRTLRAIMMDDDYRRLIRGFFSHKIEKCLLFHLFDAIHCQRFLSFIVFLPINPGYKIPFHSRRNKSNIVT